MLAELHRRPQLTQEPHPGTGVLRSLGIEALGALFVTAGVVILGFYSAIAGWTLRYAFEALIGGVAADSASRFEAIATGTPAVFSHLAFMAVTAAVVSRGIRSCSSGSR